MPSLLRLDENRPLAYPASPAGLSAGAAALDPAFLWQRLETWTARRWPARAVSFVVEGPGDWEPSLGPFTVTGVEAWTGDNWQVVTLQASPLGGYVLEGEGPYRITGTAGDDEDPPEDVMEAFRRLAEYTAGHDGAFYKAGASSYHMSVGGGLDVTLRRDPASLAKAMQNSGAADLLRNYRRA